MSSESTSSSGSSSSEEAYPVRRTTRETRVALAKKSTSQAQSATPAPGNYTTRRQAALAKDLVSKKLQSDRFLGNFNPENSVRERKKLSRKINPPSNVRRPPGALYDENGIHIASGIDQCDCLTEDCPGCFFECPECSSQKCGLECRVHRRYLYDQIEYHGYDNIVRNPLMKY